MKKYVGYEKAGGGTAATRSYLLIGTVITSAYPL